MRKRKPFFIRGNFQLKFLLFYAAILATGIFSAVYLIYRALQGVVEEAAFSSHLSLSSSGELFWPAIVRINIMIAGISVLAGLLAIAGIHYYLDGFFHDLGEGLDRLAKSDFSFRLRTKGRWWVRSLVDDFNQKMEALQKDSERTGALADSLITAIDERRPEMLKEIKSIHSKLLIFNFTKK